MGGYGVSLRASIKGARDAFQCMLVEVSGDWEFGGNRSESLRLESFVWMWGSGGLDGDANAGREAI